MNFCTEAFSQYVRKLTRESFLFLILVLGTIGGLVHGFLLTNSNSLFLLQYADPINATSTIDLFSKHLLLVTLAGELFGAMSSFLFSDSFGRKTTLFYSTVGCIFALLLELFAGGHARLLTARFLLGWSLGTMLPVGLIYIAEVFPMDHRGLAVSSMSIMCAVGSSISAIGYALATWWFTQVKCPQWLSVLPMLFFIPIAFLLTTIPESHRWLLAVKTPSECLAAMRQLRRPTDVSKEFNEIYSALSSDARLGDGWADLISNRSLRHRIGVCGVLQLTQGLVGSCIISVLATDMFAAAGASSPIALLAFMHICCLGGSALCARKVDRWGRRWVLIGGYLLIGLCWTGAFVCVHFSRKLAIASTPSLPSLIVTSAPTSISNNASNQVLMNVAAVSITQGVEFYGLYLSVSAARILLQNTFIFFILLFCIVFSATIGPVVNVVSMEVFPFRVRGKAASLLFGLGILSSLIGAFVLRPWARATIVPISEHAILTDGHMITCMLVYLITAICLSVFVLVALPDTTGLALEDMEELFDAGQTGTCSGCIGFRSRLRTPHSKTNVIPSLGSDPNLKSAGNRPSAENLPLVYYEPSTLHKYSGEMRESKFLTYWEPDDDDLLLAATSSSNGNWALSFLPDAPPNTSRH